MIKRPGLFSWIVLGPAMALAQIPAPVAPASGTPKFEVASLRVVDRNSLGRGGGGRAAGGPGTSDPGRFHDPADTMLGLLWRAFGVESGQVLGPAVQPRVGADVYEVTATMPPDTTQAQFQAMLQNLLIERFHLVFHRETRSFPGYELELDSRGPKLKQGGLQSDDGDKPANPLLLLESAGAGHIAMKEKTMEDLAKQLETVLLSAQMIQTKSVNLPTPRVIDKTGLTGKYTFSLDFASPGLTPGPDDPTGLPDLFVILREKLGLRLNKTAGVPVDVIVVDSVDKTPVAN